MVMERAIMPDAAGCEECQLGVKPLSQRLTDLLFYGVLLKIRAIRIRAIESCAITKAQ